MNLPKNKATLEKEYFSWLTKNELAKKPTISAAIQAIYNVYDKNYTQKDVDHLKNGLELNHTYSYAFAEYVHDFAKTDDVFKNLLLTLAKHRSAAIRFNCVTNCLYNYPVALVDTMLINALNDKSKRIRLKVADVLLRLNKKNLLENLKQRIQIEQDEAVKSNLIWTYELIHKKWTLALDDNRVTVQLKSGGITGFYLSDLDDTSIQSIEKEVAKIRRI